MARTQRSTHPNAFVDERDFNEQLYTALQQSPWWMISLALHVLIFFIAGMVATTKAKVPGRPPLRVAEASKTVEEEPPEVPEPTVDPTPKVIDPSEHPLLQPEELVQDPQTDVDSHFDEPFGDSDGMSTANLDGPSTNSRIGIGPGAGRNPFGRGSDTDGGGGGTGGQPNQDAVLHALEWLKAHQSAGGAWHAADFDRWCYGKPVVPSPRHDGLGKGMYDPGVTGLALCAYLGAGYTSRGKHPYRTTVAKGLRYLRNIQDAEGCFGSRSGPNYIYNHATAALAMVEAYGMTGSTLYKGAAQQAVDFIGTSRNPYFAWRYGVKPGDNDTSVTGWMMMAIKSAKLINAESLARGQSAPLSVDAGAFDGIRSWIDKMTDPDYGRVGYIARGSGPARPKELIDAFPAEKSESMTAVGVLARIFMGEDPKRSKILAKGADLCAKLPPVWNESDGSIDMYYWYYGALAMHQMGGTHWKIWKKAMDDAIVGSQRKDGDYCLYKGSWDPVGPWGPDGGRVYSTAILAMCLEVYYRYDRVFGAR